MSEYTKLQERLDRVFSKYIRMRDADQWGNVKCPICKFIDYPWQQMECAHFIKRSHFKTRWDEKNAIATCQACNQQSEHNEQIQAKFTEVMRERFESLNLTSLYAAARQEAKFTRSELLELIKYYQLKIKELNHS